MFTCGTCTFFWQPYPSQDRSAHDVPPNCSSGQWVDSLTDCGPDGRKTRFCLLGPLAAGSWGSFNMQALARPRPPALVAPAARCPLRGLGEGSCSQNHCPRGRPLPGRGGGVGCGVPLGTPGPGVRAAARPPRGLCPPPSWWLIQLGARHRRPPGLSVKFCRQSRQASLSECTGRTEAYGQLTRNQIPRDRSHPIPVPAYRVALCGVARPGGSGPALRVPAARMCWSRCQGRNMQSVLGAPGLPSVPGKRRGLLSWQPAPPPSNGPLR